jgi:PAS domain S-box-containing protein
LTMFDLHQPASGRSSQQIRAEIEARFGFFPPFFEPALPLPTVLESLWQQTLVAYVNNPLPISFKEKLFAYLSRYCAVPYCVVCHGCALRSLDITAQELLTLLTTPFPLIEQGIASDLATLAAQVAPLKEFPEPNSVLEQSLYRCSILIFLKPQDAHQAISSIRQLLGESGYIHLSSFLAYVSLCHRWVEAHPELAYEQDRRAQTYLHDLFTEVPELADFFQTYHYLVQQELRLREMQLAIEVAERQRVEQELRQSEERLRSILQNMPVMLDVFDANGNIMIWNHECERVTGYTTDEIVGNPQAMTLLYPDETYRERMIKAWQAQGNCYRNWEWELTAKDGTVKTIAWSNISDEFSVPGWTAWGIGVDVSERKQAEASLRESEERFRVIFEQAAVGITLADSRTGRYIQVNQRFCQMLGYTEAELSSLTWRDFTHPDDLGEDLAFDPQVLAGVTSNFSLEKRFIRKDGAPHWVNISVSVVRDATGSPRYDICVVEDIEERKQAELALYKSEATNRALLNAIPDMMLRIKRDGTLIDYKLAKNFSTTFQPETFLNQKLTDILPASIAVPGMQRIAQTLQTREVQVYEYQLPMDGKLNDYESRIVVCGEDEVLCIIRDISDRKRAEQEILKLNQALEQQNRNLEALVEQRTAELVTFINSLPDYIFVIEREGLRISFCNDLLAQTTGASNRHEVQGKTIFECFAPERATYFAQQNQQVFETGQPLHIQESFELATGILHLDTYKIPLRKPTGEVYALIGSSRNMTELMQARQALTKRTTQLEAINQELESFSYSVSHDLRAPLRHVTGFVVALEQQLARNNALTDPKVCHYLRVIQDSGKRMGQLIDGLLTLSRVGRRQLTPQSVDLNQLVQVAIELVEHQASVALNQSIEFVVGELPTVTGDSSLLQQVFSNLIDNAVKFSRLSQPARVEVGALADGTLFVKDNGIGFPMEYADQLFGAFQRLHANTDFEGTGIGLAIVQRIIHRHEGKIWVESQPNQGACFYFNLGQAR